ncbi:FUN14 domain-containing protein 1A-like [Bombyx mandarina]|uniref:FUN14 domain-containing protein 1A-like n=1 Tax=Bombyx mandarina TaxID=7092 RepID=A0A6J2KID1_BOMMA|nr:FUN14 domain-containing protein 1A-like [Bombyx mandarina]
MARPIPNLHDISRLNEEIKPKDSKTVLDLVIDNVRSKSSKDLVFGTLTGWMTGIMVVKVGKVAAFGLGGSVLLLHIACEYGYICVNWERIRESAGSSHVWLEKLIKFVKKNSCFSVGMLGGFFFGVAST